MSTPQGGSKDPSAMDASRMIPSQAAGTGFDVQHTSAIVGSTMRFYWTPEEVTELLKKLEPYSLDDYVAAHSSILRTQWKKVPGLQRGRDRAHEWTRVEAEARKLANWLEGHTRKGTA